MEKMKNLSLQNFNDELASSSPAPGGGAVAALCSSLAASLSSMVFSLTIDKKFYNEYDKELKNTIIAAKDFCVDKKYIFLKMMDEDTEVFNEVMAAFKLPKDTDEQKQLRSEKIQSSYIKAMEVPLKVAGVANEIFDTLRVAAQFGNPNAVSDAGVGALVAYAAIESALLNVKINLSAIKDTGLVTDVKKQCDEIMESAEYSKNDIMKIVYKKIEQ